jgi:hypothetical protein
MSHHQFQGWAAISKWARSVQGTKSKWSGYVFSIWKFYHKEQYCSLQWR